MKNPTNQSRTPLPGGANVEEFKARVKLESRQTLEDSYLKFSFLCETQWRELELRRHQVEGLENMLKLTCLTLSSAVENPESGELKGKMLLYIACLEEFRATCNEVNRHANHFQNIPFGQPLTEPAIPNPSNN
jgi:hypothetical protein